MVEVAREAGDERDRADGSGLPDEAARVRLGDRLEQRQAGPDVGATTDRERSNGQPIVGRGHEPRRVDAVDGDQLGGLARERIGLVDVRCALGHRQQLAHLDDQALARLVRVGIHGVHHGRRIMASGCDTIAAPTPAGILRTAHAGVAQWLEFQPSKLAMRVRFPSPASDRSNLVVAAAKPIAREPAVGNTWPIGLAARATEHASLNNRPITPAPDVHSDWWRNGFRVTSGQSP